MKYGDEACTWYAFPGRLTEDGDLSDAYNTSKPKEELVTHQFKTEEDFKRWADKQVALDNCVRLDADGSGDLLFAGGLIMGLHHCGRWTIRRASFVFPSSSSTKKPLVGCSQCRRPPLSYSVCANTNKTTNKQSMSNAEECLSPLSLPLSVPLPCICLSPFSLYPLSLSPSPVALNRWPRRHSSGYPP